MNTSHKLKTTTESSANLQEQLSKLFAYKAEWLDQELFDLFQSPGYLPELKLNQSCVLIGGRGTGKTTVLRGLSYEGQVKLNSTPSNKWDFYGVYYKIDSNRVSALHGLGLQDEEWRRPFSHYINLVICNLLLRMLKWYQLHNNVILILDHPSWQRFNETLALTNSTTQDFTVDSLLTLIESTINRFEIYVNNIRDNDENKPLLSILGSPIDKLTEAINTLKEFDGKYFSILFDEYENFTDYQQKVVNTLIKHSAGTNYCFKIGVRELGWRAKHTINDQELQAPNDFKKISISNILKNKQFNNFAERVCNIRLSKLSNEIPLIRNIKDLLPSISNLEEAKILGVNNLTKKIISSHINLIDDNHIKSLQSLNPMFVWFAYEWQVKKDIDSKKALLNLIDNKKTWQKRFDNYIYASLFAIREGKSGYRKYYSGWETYVLMSGGNIRLLLQLVEDAIRRHSKTSDILSAPVSIQTQTDAAISIGENNLSELEGVDVKGGKIMKLVQGIGRVFQIFAANPFGRAPEVNQFYVPELNGETKGVALQIIQVQDLLETAFSHLALQRAPSNKLSKDSSRGFDYFVHPIFSAYFQFSHRKKRKIAFSAADILGFVNNQSNTTDSIVRDKNSEHKIFIKNQNNNSKGNQLPLFNNLS